MRDKRRRYSLRRSFYAYSDILHHAAAHQICDNRTANACAHNGRDEERRNIGILRYSTCIHTHKRYSDGICQQAAKKARADDLAQHGMQHIFRLSIDNAAQHCAAHAARKRQQAAQAQQITDQARSNAIPAAYHGPSTTPASTLTICCTGAHLLKSTGKDSALPTTATAHKTPARDKRSVLFLFIFIVFRSISKIGRLQAYHSPQVHEAANTVCPLYGRGFLASSHAGTRLPIAVYTHHRALPL